MAAVLGVGLGSTNGTARAADDTLTTTLQPGWNLVGWTEGEAEVAAIFEALPAVEAVYAWDTEAQAFRGAALVGDELPGELDTLTPGMGLWLYVGGDKPVTWTRPLIPQSGAVSLDEGWNLVTWAGRDGAPTEDALEPLGDLVVATEDGSGAASTALATGGAFWLNVSAAKDWWQLTEPPVVIFGRAIPKADREALEREVDRVFYYYGRTLGIGVPQVRFRLGDERHGCGGYLGRTIFLSAGCLHGIAHDYVHALQEEMAVRNGRPLPWESEPVWLVEGSAEYWASQYRVSQYATSHEDHIQHSVIPSVQRIPVPLSRLRTYATLLVRDRGYDLPQLAVDWLVNRAGADALLAYYNYPSRSGWTSRFRLAFGLSVSEFYEEFEAYRAEVAPPLYRISGEIRAYSGNLLDGVKVAVYDRDGETLVLESTYHWDGEFALEVPEGSYLLSFSAGDCHIGWYGRLGRVVSSAKQAEPVTTSVRGTDLEVRMRTLCQRIEGNVRDADQTVAEGVRVEAFSEASGRRVATADSDAAGKFSLPVPDGSYLLSFSRDGLQLGWYSGWELTPGRSGAKPVVVDGDNIQQVFRATNLVVLLAVRVEFEGVVRYPDGSPVAGVEIIAATPGGSVARASTDADGMFSFQVREGSYVLLVRTDRCQFGWYHSRRGFTGDRDQATRVNASARGTPEINIRLRPSLDPEECGL